MTEPAKFFVPGPTWVRPEILAELCRPVIGHRSAEFRELYGRILANLKELFLTRQNAFVATCSGTALMEGALLNCVSRRVLVTTCGAFSERWMKIAEKIGVEVDHLNHPWGEAVDADRLADHIASRRGHYDAVTITLNETSTGVMNDVKELAQIVHDESPDTLVMVDAVSALASAEVRVDDWGIDVCFASVQKGLALPPGLTVFSVSDRALAQAERKPYRGMYFDFAEYKKSADSGNAAFTPAISLCYALDKQLEYIIKEEGLENRWSRHETLRQMTWDRTASFAKPRAAIENASKSITALEPLTGSAPGIVAEMKKRGYTLGGGYGEWKDATFRIGHMGDLSVTDLDAMLTVLSEVASTNR